MTLFSCCYIAVLQLKTLQLKGAGIVCHQNLPVEKSTPVIKITLNAPASKTVDALGSNYKVSLAAITFVNYKFIYWDK